MKQTTAQKLATMERSANSYKSAVSWMQDYRPGRFLPRQMKELFDGASAETLQDAHRRHETVACLALTLLTNQKEPFVGKVYLVHLGKFEGLDLKSAFRRFADDLMTAPENKAEPALRQLIEPTDEEMAEIADELESMGCIMDGTTIVKLPSLEGLQP